MVGDAFEGNLIASTFNHGDPSKRRRSVREIHDFPFAAKLSCDAARPPTATLTLEDGDDVTGTLTNDDRPGARPADAHLTLVKRVINNSGGSPPPADWVLHADGPTPLVGRSGGAAVTTVAVRHGLYALTESDVRGSTRAGAGPAPEGA